MKTVHKYLLAANTSYLTLPQGAKPLDIQFQGMQEPVIWFEVNTENPAAQREVYFVGTGNPVPPCTEYAGTFQIENEGLVFHVYLGEER